MTNVLRNPRFLDAAGLLLAIYVVTLAIMPKHVFWTPDEGAKWMTMHSVSFRGDLRYTVDFPSQRVDTQFNYLPHYGIFPRPQIQPDGSIYLGFETPVLFPLLSSIPFHIFGLTGIYLLPLLGGWLVAVLAGLVATTVREESGPPAVLVVGLATPIWFYSMLFWEHTLASLLGMMAVTIVAVAPPRNVTALLVALALTVAASAFRMEILALAAALPIAWGIAGYVAPRRREESVNLKLRWPLPGWTLPIAALVVAAGIAVFLDAALTVRHHGFIETLPQRLQRGLTALVESPWSMVDMLVHTSIQEAAVVSDTWVLTALVAVLLCGAAAFVSRPVAEGVLLLTGLGLLLAFSVSLLAEWTTYRAMHGFFPVAPFMVIWLYAWSASRPDQRGYSLLFLTILMVAYLVVGLVAISALYVEQGRLDVGLEWGQRYFLTLYAIAGVLSVVALQVYWRSARPVWLKRSFVAAVTLLAFVAVGFELRGLGMLYGTRVRLAVWDHAMRQEGPIVTDLWWLPAALAVLFTEHEVYYVHRRADVAGWAAQASQHGIKGFTFAGVRPVEPAELGNPAFRRTRLLPRDINGLFLTRFLLAPDEIEPHPGE